MRNVITAAEMRETFMQTTAELMDADSRLSLVLAAIGAGGDQLGPLLRKHPERAFDVGIREQLMVGMAAGTALEGYRPILHSYAPFLVERAFEQIKLDFVHQGLSGILVSTGASYDWSQGGYTHYSPSDVALLGSIPGFTVHVPGHAAEVDAVLREAAGSEERVYVRLSTRSNAEPFPEGIGGFAPFSQGRQGVVVAVGPMLDPVLEAVRDLDITVVYTATPSNLAKFPVDAFGREAVVLVEPYLEGTSASRISEAMGRKMHRLLSIGVKNRDLHRYGTPEDHDRWNGIDPQSMRARIVDFLY
ncbi:transketolase family protein [Salininema proteolyticum]|uniref:Transketolase family protein n=1 Tax=Salininema proteolyticum TaxID=1607685 RepID=A0ABV8TYT1_9ACTN